MKKTVLIITLFFAAGLLLACQGGQKFHKTDMPDPAAFDARFGDLDKNGDGAVNWSEFKRSFPEAEPQVFMELDMNDDAAIDAEEWGQFQKAHGM